MSPVDVTALGAAGDGAADDAPAIQSALDAGGWVYVPPGTYRLASILRGPAAGRLRLTLAPGATLLRDHDEGIIFTSTPAGGSAGGYGGPGDILIEGGTWDVAGVAHPAYAGAIAVAHGAGITIRDAAFLDVPGWHAIEINGCRTVRVRDCRFAGFAHTGDRGYSEAIQVDAMTSTGVYPWGGPYDGTPCDDVEISGCWVGASGTPGTQAWPRGVGSHNVNADHHTRIRVVGNAMDGVTDCGIQAVRWAQSRISGNQVAGSGGEGIAVRTGSLHVDVDGNQVADSGRSGIWLNDGVSQISVRDNTVIGSGRAEHATHYGIRGSNSATWLLITGNRVRRRSSGNHAAYGLSLTSTCGGVMRYGNDLRYGGVLGGLDDHSSSPVTSAGDAA